MPEKKATIWGVFSRWLWVETLSPLTNTAEPLMNSPLADNQKQNWTFSGSIPLLVTPMLIRPCFLKLSTGLIAPSIKNWIRPGKSYPPNQARKLCDSWQCQVFKLWVYLMTVTDDSVKCLNCMCVTDESVKCSNYECNWQQHQGCKLHMWLMTVSRVQIACVTVFKLHA